MTEQKFSRASFNNVSPSAANVCPMHSLQMALRELRQNLQKAEEQISKLTKCKAELSTEIVNVKESNLRLQKENTKCEKECQKLRQKLLTASNTNADLTEQLSEVTLENQKLSAQMSMASENPTWKHYHNAHTYPWTQQPRPARPNPRWQANSYTETWEEVSRQLLMQMKSEMKDIEDFGKKLAAIEHVTTTQKQSENTEGSLDDEMKELKAIHSTNEQIKERLLSQNQKLQVIVLKLLSTQKKREALHQQQQQQQASAAAAAAARRVVEEEERICPVCEAVFPSSIPRQDFDFHVVRHLELDNFNLVAQTQIL